MTDKKHSTLSSSTTALKPNAASSSLLAKTSSSAAAAQMFQANASSPSFEAYLEAYRSLLAAAGGTMSAAPDPTAALAALAGGGYPVRPSTAGCVPMSMPFVSSPYFTFPSLTPMDVSNYGLVSPVFLPPFFASLYACDPSSAAAAAAAAFGTTGAVAGAGAGYLTGADYRDLMGSKLTSWPAASATTTASGSKVESKASRMTHDVVKDAKQQSSAAGGGIAKSDPLSYHSTSGSVRSSSVKDAPRQHQQPSQHQNHVQHHHHQQPPQQPAPGGGSKNAAVPRSSPIHGATVPDQSAFGRNSKNSLPPTMTEGKAKQPPRSTDTAVGGRADHDVGPIDFSVSAATGRPALTASKETTAVNLKVNAAAGRTSIDGTGPSVIPSRASVVVAPGSDRHSGRHSESSGQHDSVETKTISPYDRIVPGSKETPSQQSLKPTPMLIDSRKPLENGRGAKNFAGSASGKPMYGVLTPDATTNGGKTMASSQQPSGSHPPPLQLDASTLSLLKNVKPDIQPLVRLESVSTAAGLSSSAVAVTSAAAVMSMTGNSGLSQQKSPVELTAATAAALTGNIASRRRSSRSDRGKRHHDPLSVSSTSTAADQGSAAGAASSGGTAASAAAAGGVEEFRCSLCNYSGRSQHCLTKHMRAHDVAYKICQYCRRAFERPSDLLRHEERHRRRDVSGSSPLGGGVSTPLKPSPTVVTDTPPVAASGNVTTPAAAAVPSVASCLSVGRVDSYSGGSLEWTNLVAVGVGTGDNEVVLEVDNLPTATLSSSRPAPEPSKLRDVYSIMAGIVVAQSLAAAMNPAGKPPDSVIPSFIDILGVQPATPTVTELVDSTADENVSAVVHSPSVVEPPIPPPTASSANKVEFLRKLELGITDADVCGSVSEAFQAVVAATAISECGLPGDVASAGEATGRKHRRKGRPIRAAVVVDEAERSLVSTKTGADEGLRRESDEGESEMSVNKIENVKPIKRGSWRNSEDHDDDEVAISSVPKKRIALDSVNVDDNVSANEDVAPPTASEEILQQESRRPGQKTVLAHEQFARRKNCSAANKLLRQCRFTGLRRTNRRRGSLKTAVDGSGNKTDSNGNSLIQKTHPCRRCDRGFPTFAELLRHRWSEHRSEGKAQKCSELDGDKEAATETDHRNGLCKCVTSDVRLSDGEIASDQLSNVAADS